MTANESNAIIQWEASTRSRRGVDSRIWREAGSRMQWDTAIRINMDARSRILREAEERATQ